MKLDRDTYEAWLLDRMEGKLSAAQEALLDGFLADNPDLTVSSDGLPGISGGDLEFALKDRLRKAYPPTGGPDAARLDDFLVARLEKDLGADQEKQLERYLYEHPEADRQAALMALAKVSTVGVPFSGKETLERHFPPKGMPDMHRLTDFLIADLEGDLSLEQGAALRRYLAEHAGSEREIRLVAATRTTPVPMLFRDRDALKKREARVVALWPRLAAAACFLLLLGAGWWWLREKPTGGPEIAHIAKPAVHQKIRSVDLNVHPVAPEPPVAIEQEDLDPPTTRPAPVEHPAAIKGTTTIKAHPPITEPARPTGQEAEPLDAPDAQPVPDELPMEEPALAQQAEEPTAVPTVPETAPSATSPQVNGMAPSSARTEGSSQDLGMFVANTLRGKMLQTPERNAELDRNDVLAFADKAIGTVTGGQGGVEVQHTSAGRRFQLRLGRNFSISSSRDR